MPSVYEVTWSAILTLGFVPYALPLAAGPPLLACHRMRPGTRVGQEIEVGHTRPPQNEWPTGQFTRDPPYYVQMNGNQYIPNQRFQFSVVANQTGMHNFYRGIFVQARRVKCASNGTVGVYDDPLGEFSLPALSTLKLMDCEKKAKSAVSHSMPNWKINETMYWTAPAAYSGHIILKMTIVRQRIVYWTNLNSTILMDPNSKPPPPCRGHHWQASVLLLIWALVAVWTTKIS